MRKSPEKDLGDLLKMSLLPTEGGKRPRRCFRGYEGGGGGRSASDLPSSVCTQSLAARKGGREGRVSSRVGRIEVDRRIRCRSDEVKKGLELHNKEIWFE